MLGGLGLEFAGRRDERQKGQVDIDARAARLFLAELADRLEVRQALDIADGATDLDQHEIEAVIAGFDEVLDGVGHMGDHLHRAAEEIAAPFLGDNILVDAAGGDVVLFVGVAAGEAFVVAQVEISLCAVVGDEHLAVLIGAHGPRIDVQIGIELAQAH
jgi:hypothetical protein